MTRERWICKFSQKGPPTCTAKVNFDDHRELCWHTMAPPRHWWDEDEDWSHVLRTRGWIWDGWLTIPGTEDRRRGGASRPRAAQFWRDLAKWPSDFHWEADVEDWSPISRMAEQIVVDFPSYDPMRWPSKRIRNVRKKQVAMYKRRVFVYDDDDQAL